MRSVKTDLRSAFWLFAILLVALPTGAQPKKKRAANLREIDAALRACSGPGAAVARARIHQGDAAVASSEVLPNPDVQFQQNQSVTGPLDRETIIGVNIPLGLGGGYFVRQEAAAAERQAIALSAGASSFDIAVEVRERFARASIAQARMETYREQRDAIGVLMTKLSKLEAGGEAAEYDILRLDAQRAAIDLKLKPSRAAVEAERAWLEVVVGMPVVIDGGAAKRLDRAVSRARAKKRGPHPTTVALKKRAEAHRLYATAAERRWAPDVDVFLGYRLVGGGTALTGHGFSIGLALPLTFFDYGQGEARRARARAEVSEARASLAKRRFAADAAAANKRMDNLKSKGSGAQAVTLASRWVESSHRLYLAGEGSLLDVLEALQARTQAKLALLDVDTARLDTHVAWMRSAGRLVDARLEKACGIAGKAK